LDTLHRGRKRNPDAHDPGDTYSGAHAHDRRQRDGDTDHGWDTHANSFRWDLHIVLVRRHEPE
jgi:hypothetical protein